MRPRPRCYKILQVRGSAFRASADLPLSVALAAIAWFHRADRKKHESGFTLSRRPSWKRCFWLRRSSHSISRRCRLHLGSHSNFSAVFFSAALLTYITCESADFAAVSLLFIYRPRKSRHSVKLDLLNGVEKINRLRKATFLQQSWLSHPVLAKQNLWCFKQFVCVGPYLSKSFVPVPLLTVKTVRTVPKYAFPILSKKVTFTDIFG